MPEEQQEGPAAELQGKDLILHLGGGSDSTPPDPKAQRLKSWANIIATTAALLTAVAAIFKPQDQTVSRNTYEQLKTAIEQTQQDVKQNHDDMVALHNYLAGYYAGNSSFSLPPLQQTPGVDAGAAMVIPLAHDAGVIVVPPASHTPYPLPTVATANPPAPLPPFDSVAAKK